jgi:hypothetical protein
MLVQWAVADFDASTTHLKSFFIYFQIVLLLHCLFFVALLIVYMLAC